MYWYYNDVFIYMIMFLLFIDQTFLFKRHLERFIFLKLSIVLCLIHFFILKQVETLFY